MAAGEDQTEAIVFDLRVIIVLTGGSSVDARFRVGYKVFLGTVEARATAHPVDGLEACR
jgi:hypothetical protein